MKFTMNWLVVDLQWSLLSGMFLVLFKKTYSSIYRNLNNKYNKHFKLYFTKNTNKN